MMNFFKKNPFITVLLFILVMGFLINLHNLFMVAVLLILALLDAIFTNIMLKRLYKKKGKKAFSHELNPLAREIYTNHSFEAAFSITFLVGFTVIMLLGITILRGNTELFYFMYGMYLIIHMVHISNFNRLK